MTGELHYFHPGIENPDACSKCGMGRHIEPYPTGERPTPHITDRLIEKLNSIDQGVKHDVGKLPLHLLPVVPIESVAQVLQHGATKYKPRNWEKGMSWSRVYAAALRHLFAFWKGEDLDPDSGLPHLAHAACDILYLLEYQQTHLELDDRPRR